eukprot:sb/3461854/
MTLNSSFNASFHSLNSTSTISFTTPLREADSSFKLGASPKIRKRVSDINDLSNYLKEYEEKDKWMARGTSDRSLSSGWAPRASETLPPRTYFLASQNQSVSVSGDTSYYNQQAADALLERLGVSAPYLDSWTQNIRTWLARTIFQHLHSEIQMINKTLEQIGSAECKIGSVSTAVLSKISTNKHEHMANIGMFCSDPLRLLSISTQQFEAIPLILFSPSAKVLPYLEVSVNQEYLVHRIGELAAGSCLGCFRWESGGQYKNAPWNKELPTDSQIVAHCINTYLDSHLPRNPMYPEGRTFTTQYFVQTPNKADSKKREYALFQSSIHPPHFKVLVEDEVWEVSKGRNNLFHSLLLLLFHLRSEEHGMLGPVNLGPTGLNMLWIIGNFSTVELCWRDVCVDVHVKKGMLCFRKGVERKPILNNVSGYAKSGELLAIMGSSGCGKSTLLNALSGKTNRDMTNTGEIFANGERLGRDIAHIASYIQQEDLFIGTMTVLLGKPLIFADEPTSGLDADMAEKIVIFLKRLANSQRNIIVTIHQPSSDVFSLFDSIMLLHDGSVAYIGPRTGAPRFFSEFGYSCPSDYNPADFYIKTLAAQPRTTAMSSSCNTTDVEISGMTNNHVAAGARASCQIVRGYVGSAEKQEADRVIKELMVKNNQKLKLNTAGRVGCWRQFMVCSWRNFKILTRNPILNHIRVVQHIAVAIVFGLAFLQLDHDRDRDVAGCLFLIVYMLSLFGVFNNIQVLPTELPLFVREYKSGAYGIFPWYIAKALMEVPACVVLPLIFNLICYFMIFKDPIFFKFLYLWLISALSILTSTSIAFFVSVIGWEPLDTLAIAPTVYAPYFLFCGMFILIENCPKYMLPFQTTSWLRWGFEGAIISYFGSYGGQIGKTFRCLYVPPQVSGQST